MNLFKLSFILAGSLFFSGAATATEKLYMPLATPHFTPAPTATPSHSDVEPETSSKDGYWIYPYPGGSAESEGNLSLGRKQGIWKYWREDGTEIREMEFHKGLFTGRLLLMDPGGRQKYFAHFDEMVVKYLPYASQWSAFIPYLVDLDGDGEDEVLL